MEPSRLPSRSVHFIADTLHHNISTGRQKKKWNEKKTVPYPLVLGSAVEEILVLWGGTESAFCCTGTRANTWTLWVTLASGPAGDKRICGPQLPWEVGVAATKRGGRGLECGGLGGPLRVLRGQRWRHTTAAGLAFRENSGGVGGCHAGSWELACPFEGQSKGFLSRSLWD